MPLRIFYASDSTPNAWFQAVRSNIWRNNLLLSLRDLGHEVVEFDFNLTQTFRNLDPADPRQAAFIAVNRPRLSAELLRQLRAAHDAKPIDLFFSYFFDACIEPAALDHIRATRNPLNGKNIKAVNWYCNGSYQLHLVREISPHYDFCLVPEKFRLSDYVAMGARPIYCQEAANPNIYKPHDVPQDYDVTFVGQAYGERPLLIQHLFNAGHTPHVFGHSWRNPHPRYFSKATFDAIQSIPEAFRHDPLSDDELVKMYSRSRINLGFSTCGDTHLEPATRVVQVRLRDFEVPMSGGFYLVQHSDELADFFTPGKEIATFTTPDDLAEKVRYYLAHADEREAIRQAGYARARRDHTWHQRFQTAFAEMGL